MSLTLEEKRQRQREITHKYDTIRRAKITAIKLARGCIDCGYKQHGAALEFDHLPGTQKKFAIGASAGTPWKIVVEEMAKCEVVCSNCHRIRTANRRLIKEA